MKTLILFILLSQLAFAQDSLVKPIKIKKNNIHFSLAGENLEGISLNYERLLFKKGIINLRGGIGIGYNTVFYFDITNPIYMTLDLGKKKHFASISAGINNDFDTKPYPKTKTERETFKNNPPEPLLLDTYHPPYRTIFFVGLGYTLITKKGFFIRPEICLIRWQTSRYFSARYSPFPKLKIGYAF